ncbi:uncharacterized protein UDID_18960 [Ustilago sp. UG-2017a]|nr:uncharacterized protein UDID_18960 [Ustilago sp. UG-2017a]
MPAIVGKDTDQTAWRSRAVFLQQSIQTLNLLRKAQSGMNTRSCDFTGLRPIVTTDIGIPAIQYARSLSSSVHTLLHIKHRNKDLGCNRIIDGHNRNQVKPSERRRTEQVARGWNEKAENSVGLEPAKSFGDSAASLGCAVATLTRTRERPH